MLQNAYFLAKIGVDTAENEQHFAEILPIDCRVADRCGPRDHSSAATGCWSDIRTVPETSSILRYLAFLARPETARSGKLYRARSRLYRGQLFLKKLCV